jgi:hypothetical protein
MSESVLSFTIKKSLFVFGYMAYSLAITTALANSRPSSYLLFYYMHLVSIFTVTGTTPS